ncbi:MAG: alanine--tRNA ligase-related protein [Ilumatobacteraceae bacterium]
MTTTTGRASASESSPSTPGPALLVSDGVFPSNENRGYVLRRILRRAVRHAFLLGADKLVMPELVATSIDVMREAYPDLEKNRDFILDVITRGGPLPSDPQDRAHDPGQGTRRRHHRAPGTTAFTLHDTYGFPLEVTTEITAEREVEVDIEGFNTEMAQQRERAKAARKTNEADDTLVEQYRELVEQFGTTEFLGYGESSADARVLAVLDGAIPGTVEIFLDRTPFYAESGGQVGDTGTITTESGRAEVLDTTFALPGLRRHVAKLTDGTISPGQAATASIDDDRRTAIRRNHTATHLLHWALRKVLGGHVKQAGSMVADDRLRFDFSHYAAVSPEEIEEIERLVNDETLANASVRSYETSKDEALAMGAMAFFGDKYGDMVRVLEAGPNSLELCGGTHVRATGDIGTIKVVSEGSIGSNLRRIEAITGASSVALLQRDERQLSDVARLVGAKPDEVVDGVQRKLDEIKGLQDELKAMRAKLAAGRAAELAETATDGVFVGRVDDLAPGDLRDLAIAVRQQGVATVVLLGRSDSGGASLVAAVDPSSGRQAAELIRDAAKAVKGGGGARATWPSPGERIPAGWTRHSPSPRPRPGRRPERRAGAGHRPRVEAGRHRGVGLLRHHRLAVARAPTHQVAPRGSSSHHGPRS